MASVRVIFPSDLEGMLRSEIWNYKTDPPHNGAGFSFCSFPSNGYEQERVTIGELPIKQPPNLFIFTLSECKVTLDIKTILAYTKY